LTDAHLVARDDMENRSLMSQELFDWLDEVFK
jgi:hypothetical protein